MTYGLHQLVWQLFTKDERRQHLFREDQSSDGMPVIYTLSSSAPMVESKVFDIQTKVFNPKLVKGSKLQYSLRVNPTVARGGKRHDVLMNAKRELGEKVNPAEIRNRMDAAAQAWFASPERLERWGINLNHLPQVDVYTQHKTRRRGATVRYSSVDLQGVLTVSDPPKFLASVNSGFGRSKAFGCGLMLIRRT